MKPTLNELRADAARLASLWMHGARCSVVDGLTACVTDGDLAEHEKPIDAPLYLWRGDSGSSSLRVALTAMVLSLLPHFEQNAMLTTLERHL